MVSRIEIRKTQRRINGKQKGASEERKICKLYSLWVSGGKDEDLFWRSAMSGGRATVAHKQGKANRQSGDMCSVSPEGHKLTSIFFIEIKHYKKLQIDKFILLNKGTLAEFWKVCIREAIKHNRRPMLVAKQNGFPEIVITLPNDIHSFCNASASLTFDPEIRLLDDLLSLPFRVALT